MTRKNRSILLFFVIVLVIIGATMMWQQLRKSGQATPNTAAVIREAIVYLPSVDTAGQGEGSLPVEAALAQRRSVRDYRPDPLALAEVGQLLWAAQGVTGADGRKRTAPSAGALYPLEVYLVAGRVEGLPAGIYHYLPGEHALQPVARGDIRALLSEAALDQDCVRDGPISLVFAAVYDRTTVKYGDRGIRYAHMEVGHAAQNVYLQAKSLGLGTVMVGAFHDDRVHEVVRMGAAEEPLAIMPAGRPR